MTQNKVTRDDSFGADGGVSGAGPFHVCFGIGCVCGRSDELFGGSDVYDGSGGFTREFRESGGFKGLAKIAQELALSDSDSGSSGGCCLYEEDASAEYVQSGVEYAGTVVRNVEAVFGPGHCYLSLFSESARDRVKEKLGANPSVEKLVPCLSDAYPHWGPVKDLAFKPVGGGVLHVVPAGAGDYAIDCVVQCYAKVITSGEEVTLDGFGTLRRDDVVGAPSVYGFVGDGASSVHTMHDAVGVPRAMTPPPEVDLGPTCDVAPRNSVPVAASLGTSVYPVGLVRGAKGGKNASEFARAMVALDNACLGPGTLPVVFDKSLSGIGDARLPDYEDVGARNLELVAPLQRWMGGKAFALRAPMWAFLLRQGLTATRIGGRDAVVYSVEAVHGDICVVVQGYGAFQFYGSEGVAVGDSVYVRTYAGDPVLDWYAKRRIDRFSGFASLCENEDPDVLLFGKHLFGTGGQARATLSTTVVEGDRNDGTDLVQLSGEGLLSASSFGSVVSLDAMRYGLCRVGPIRLAGIRDVAVGVAPGAKVDVTLPDPTNVVVGVDDYALDDGGPDFGSKWYAKI